MRNKIIFSTIILALCLIPTVLADTELVTFSHYQAQFQWRANQPYGSWSYHYQNVWVTSEYTLTGNALHTEWTYQPYVEHERSEKTVYIYDRLTETWVEKAGQVKYVYTPLYGDYTVVNYFRGYLDFGGAAPGESTFVHGVAYQHIYIQRPQQDTGVTDILPYAQWDSSMNAWLVGYSIYYWDVSTQLYNPPFPALV